MFTEEVLNLRDDIRASKRMIGQLEDKLDWMYGHAKEITKQHDIHKNQEFVKRVNSYLSELLG